MEEHFDLTVSYDQTERVYKAVFQKSGYSYRIIVFIDDMEVYFEPDEERNFRAIINTGSEKTADPLLIQAIGHTLEKALK